MSWQVREGLRTFSNWPTYPQLYVEGKLIGGLDIVKELKEEGELNDALGYGRRVRSTSAGGGGERWCVVGVGVMTAS